LLMPSINQARNNNSRSPSRQCLFYKVPKRLIK